MYHCGDHEAVAPPTRGTTASLDDWRLAGQGAAQQAHQSEETRNYLIQRVAYPNTNTTRESL